MDLLSGGRRRRGAKRPEGYLASTLGEADALRAVLNQAQHLEAQALHGGERWGRRRSPGDSAQDLVFLGAELQHSFSSVHDRPTQRGGKNARPTGEGRAGGSQPVVEFAAPAAKRDGSTSSANQRGLSSGVAPEVAATALAAGCNRRAKVAITSCTS